MSVRSRELAWDGCINVRDLGGIPLEGGGETRTGVLVRSDNVRLLTEEGRRALVEHGVVRVVDLRWPEEVALDPRDDLPVDVVHVSLLGELDPDYHDDVDTYMAAGDPAGYWTASYSSMFEQYPQQFRAALAAIADADGPVVFHCAGGKDRTGLIAALLLRLAGVSIDGVALDYALTRVDPAWCERAADERDRARRTFMQNTPAEAMRGALEHLDRAYGGAEGYMRTCGLDDVRIARLRDRLRA